MGMGIYTEMLYSQNYAPAEWRNRQIGDLRGRWRSVRLNPASLLAIADRLRALRVSTGLKQVEFCRLVGLSTAQWNNYERARERIAVDPALQVCERTGATMDYIYRGTVSSLPLNLALALQKIGDRPAA
jgi:DNA-binding XRE family transcriptional regulator